MREGGRANKGANKTDTGGSCTGWEQEGGGIVATERGKGRGREGEMAEATNRPGIEGEPGNSNQPGMAKGKGNVRKGLQNKPGPHRGTK